MADYDPTTRIIAEGLEPEHLDHLQHLLGDFALSYPGVTFRLESPKRETEPAPPPKPETGAVLIQAPEDSPYLSSMVTWYERWDGSKVAVVTKENLYAYPDYPKETDKSLAVRAYNGVMRFSHQLPQLREYLEIDGMSARTQPILGIKVESVDGLINDLGDHIDQISNFGEGSLGLLEEYFSKIVPKPKA